MKKFTTLRPEYLPSLDYFWKIVQCDYIILTDHLQYTKRSAVTISPMLDKPEQCLRIPVRHKPLLQSISLKEIDEHDQWRRIHMRTLHHVYHHFPYGYYYLPLLNELYMKAGSQLSDLLFTLIENISLWLHADISLYRSTQAEITADHYSFIKSWAKRFHPATYLVADETLENEWLKPEQLLSHHIVYQKFQNFPRYHILQTYKSKSILTFLMQFGPEAGYLIRQYH